MRQRNIGWRLDMVLASTPIADRTISYVVQREFGSSDHGPVIATFAPLVAVLAPLPTTLVSPSIVNVWLNLAGPLEPLIVIDVG
jgi:hypothetical protein